MSLVMLCSMRIYFLLPLLIQMLVVVFEKKFFSFPQPHLPHCMIGVHKLMTIICKLFLLLILHRFRIKGQLVLLRKLAQILKKQVKTAHQIMI